MTPEQRETHAAVLRDLVQDAATEARPEMTDARVFACLAGAAALRAPAVTGGAERPATTGAMLAQKVERLHQFIYSASGSGENEAHATIREVLALLASLAAPPAAGAPPALVALVQEFQRTYHADKDNPSVATFRPHMRAYQALVEWSPAPAPVAPPSETFEPPMGVCQWLDEGSDYTTECGHGWQFIDGGVELNDAKFCPFCGGKIQVVDERPAPPAVAGGGGVDAVCATCGELLGPARKDWFFYEHGAEHMACFSRRRREGA